MIDYWRVGHRIKTTRRLMGFTREEIAKKTGLDFFTIASIERGECEKYEAIDAVCYALGMDTEYVLDPTNKEAAAKVWGNLTDEEISRVYSLIRQIKRWPGI